MCLSLPCRLTIVKLLLSCELGVELFSRSLLSFMRLSLPCCLTIVKRLLNCELGVELFGRNLLSFMRLSLPCCLTIVKLLLSCKLGVELFDWWAQVDSNHQLICLCQTSLAKAGLLNRFLKTSTDLIGGLKWTRTTDLTLIRRAL